MPKEITNLPPLGGAPAEADELVVYDVSATAPNTKKVTLSELLTGVAFAGGNHNFGVSTISTLTVSTRLTVGTANISGIYRGTATLTSFTIGAGATHTEAVTLSGAQVGDTICASMRSGVENGVIFSYFISGANTVTVKFTNTTGSTIPDSTRLIDMFSVRFI